MANQTASFPWIIDTAGAGFLCTQMVKIRELVFLPALDADTVTVQDVNGRLVWLGNGSADLEPVRSGHLGWVQGLAVTALSANTKLLIYLE